MARIIAGTTDINVCAAKNLRGTRPTKYDRGIPGPQTGEAGA
jgi:hypothetical protein